ncbi:MAG: YfgM family protein [Burkholderiales bacterium]
MYDLEEQEQIAALKAFWAEYGRMIIAGVAAFVIGVSGVQGWRYYQRTNAEQASSLYGKLETAVNKGDTTEIRSAGTEILSRYSATPYAAMAALVMAKTEYDDGKADAAAKQLEWALEHAKSDEVRSMARLRLAGVLLDQKKYDDAIKLLEAKVSDSFVALYADMRGDVLVAQGKNADARAAYQQALDKTVHGNPWRGVVQLKLDALGSAQ